MANDGKKPLGIIANLQSLRLFGGPGPESSKLEYKGFDQLKPMQGTAAKQLVAKYYDKIRREHIKTASEIRYFLTEIREFKKTPVETKRIKYAVHIRLAMPSHVFNADAHDFDLNKALSEALQEVTAQVQRHKEKIRGKRSFKGIGRRKVFESLMREESRE